MPKLPVLSGEELIKILKKKGFEVIRQKGSHVSLKKITATMTFQTIVPMHRELAKGTLRDILNQCGLEKEDLFK
jgi:predicted RNA binding protein YcfA (HicA-like mRNA interferase family)